ncbi:RNA polymerase sigma factor [Spirosoma migulaei]
MDASLTDEEMIRQYLTSRPNQCFETLYNRYVNKVYRRCLSMTKDTDKAEDFTQDIFLKVFDKLDGFQERSSFSTWLYSIAFNYCSDQLRKAKRFHFAPIEDGLQQDIPDTEDSQYHEETLLLVKQVMASLSESEQTLLQLKYEQELSIDEIAKVYKINPSAVKMRLKRSRDKIHRLYLKQYTVGRQ